MFDVLIDALVDSLKIFPVLFLVYLLIEYLLHKKQKNFYEFVAKSKKIQPLWASFLGAVPQCGFSAVMADGFSKRGITFGALIAVFISTSDEAFPLLIAHPSLYGKLALLIAIKVVYALIVGFSIDFVINLITSRKLQPVDLHSKEEHTHLEHDHCCADNIFLNAFKHSLNIFIYLLIATAVINTLIYFIGIENISAFISAQGYLQVLIAPLIGLIPNCASSVILVELFIENALSFSALLAGLSAGAGVGLLVLFKNNKNLKQNFLIVGLLYLLSVLLGTILHFCGI